jgi:hypothetical protein
LKKFFKKKVLSQMWWYMPVIPAFWKLKQKNLEFEIIYLMNSRTALVT